jgi:gamma-glutamylcyclotransferase (GGCT)/AIG2-like uncharacterized protein YtfP
MRRARARYLGNASVRGRLFDLGEFPGAVKTPGASAQVMGELYYLPGAVRTLKFLDQYEGKRYRRDVTEIEFRSGRRVPAWIYWLKRVPASSRLIEGRECDL